MATVMGGGVYTACWARRGVPVFVLILLLAALVAVCGCGAPKPPPQEDITAAEDGPEEALSEGEAFADTTAGGAGLEVKIPERPAYRLVVGDRISVRFFYYPAYDIALLVRPDGMLTIPLVGTIQAEGMTPSDIEGIVRAKYAEVLAEPEVSVIVSEFADQRVFVFGEVNNPGAFELKGSSTVLDAVAAAGGITYNGRSDSVILIRQAPDGMFAGTRVNLQSLLAGRSSEDVLLNAGDVIYVPMTFIAKVNVFVDQFFAKLSPTWYFFISGREVLNPEGKFLIGR